MPLGAIDLIAPDFIPGELRGSFLRMLRGGVKAVVPDFIPGVRVLPVRVACGGVDFSFADLERGAGLRAFGVLGRVVELHEFKWALTSLRTRAASSSLRS